jgi:large subunit ribosomal protein L21
MENYAILETGSKQYRVQKGDVIDVELIAGDRGDVVTFNDVLYINVDGKVLTGSPAIAGACITAEVLGPVRGPKVISYKYRLRKNYRRKVGHRQDYTRVKITGVQHGS